MKKSTFFQITILLFLFNAKIFSQCIDSANPIWNPVPSDNPTTATLIYNLTPTSNIIGTVNFTGSNINFSNGLNNDITTFSKSAAGEITVSFNTLVYKPSIAQGMAQSFNISNISSSRGQIITGFDENSIPVYPIFANSASIVISGSNMNEVTGAAFQVGSTDFTFPQTSPIKSLTISRKSSSVTTGVVNITFKPICASVPTPVELVFFKANASNNAIKLNWQTASEKNNKGFEIERSVDAVFWENIGAIKGQGTSNVVVNYSFEDKHPLSILTYYRLKQVDFDGKENFSNIESISLDKKRLLFEIYPNPISNKEATLILDEDLLEGTLTVFNSIGSVVKKEKINSQNPTFDLHNLTNGIYFFNVQKGSNFHSKKIIITE